MAFLLERHDHSKPLLRAACRELLSSCVLRSIMTFFTPYTANKARPVLACTSGLSSTCRSRVSVQCQGW